MMSARIPLVVGQLDERAYLAHVQMHVEHEPRMEEWRRLEKTQPTHQEARDGHRHRTEP
jgi:hypothetical protein